jgi:simple sugar transport system ATP-binding protein
MPNALQLIGIMKTFGPVQALGGADFVLRPGTVHALLGENGAGKTTLMQVAFGLVAPDAGVVQVEGRPVRIESPRDARRLGIGMVHQHFTSVPALTVRENLELAGGQAGGQAGGFLAGLELEARVEDLSVGQKQRLEVAKALSTGSRILLLDEPTAVLVPSEIETLLGAVRDFAAAGGAAVLITHKLDEVLAAADDVTVLRKGVVTLTGPLEKESRDTLAQAMIGESQVQAAESRPAPRASRPPVVTLLDVTIAPRNARSPGLLNASLVVHPGEIVGIAAVEGNGQRELMLAVAGVLRAKTGAVEVTGPVALVPEDRTIEGLVPAMSVVENVVLGRGTDPAWSRGPWIDWKSAERVTSNILSRFDVRAPGPRATTATLSGGNQQKLVLGRGLSTRPRVLVVENPTRGLDLRATADMQRHLRAAAEEGVAVLVHSSDLDEVLQLAHRLLVVCRGELMELAPPFERGRVGQAMLGVAAA